MMLPKQTITGCGDASCELLVSPIPRPKVRPLTILTKPRRSRVVIMDHGKPNSLAILTRAQTLLRERGIEVMDEILRKPSATTWMGDALCAKLAEEDGVVLCGISDCGSCSAGSVLDAVALQRRGVAGFPVLTAPFRDVVDRTMAYYECDRPLPVVVIEHPTQNVSNEDLQDRARQIADAAERLVRGLDI